MQNIKTKTLLKPKNLQKQITVKITPIAFVLLTMEDIMKNIGGLR